MTGGVSSHVALKRGRCQGSRYIRGQSLDRPASHGAEVFRAGLATLAIDLRFERKLLAFIERAHAGALDGADMHEHVVAAVVGLNEAKTLGRVEPLNCSGRHLTSPRCAYALTPARPSRGLDPISAMSWGGEPVRRVQQANRLFEWEAFTLLTAE